MPEQMDSILTNDIRDICIIGSGLSGLCCSRNLAKLGFKVHIIEQLNTLGGLVRSAKIGDEYVELLPHHLRKTDRSLLQLCKEVGIKDKINWHDSLWQGRASNRKIGYFDGGFNDLTNALSQDITDNGGVFYYSTVATEIVYNSQASGIQSSGSDEKTKRFCVKCILNNNTKFKLYCDFVVFTGPCNQVLTNSPSIPLPKEYKKSLKSMRYSSKFSLMLLLKKNPSELYFRYLEDSNIPFSYIVNHSTCFGERKYGGHLVYLVGDVDSDGPLWTEDDETIKKLYVNAFQKLYPSIKKSDIKSWRLTKCKFAAADEFPQVEIVNPISGLYLCSPAVISASIDKKLDNRMEYAVKLSEVVANNIVSTVRQERLNDVSNTMRKAIRDII
ncbi:MAG: FAD-dependent oxidoreductase [Clostridia bacterium]|nr:FAD-dependent oxidoreductase [Clostridia bacterium]